MFFTNLITRVLSGPAHRFYQASCGEGSGECKQSGTVQAGMLTQYRMSGTGMWREDLTGGHPAISPKNKRTFPEKALLTQPLPEEESHTIK